MSVSTVSFGFGNHQGTQRSADDPFNLKRFANEHRKHAAVAIKEIKAGRKKGHWSWFMMPTPPFEVNGAEMGSPMNKAFAIRSDEEARAFLQYQSGDVNLRQNYLDLLLAIHEQLQSGKTAVALVGSSDEPKLQSSVAFFERITREGVDDEVNAACVDVAACLQTNASTCCAVQ
eukprot:gnl/TRDRNA2_/TRDRNA2_167790_c1_seq1.p1 gnl/TRDRNA2_/TRDRNA2_167790_c1~~gnl/TRDRNA2_/TRDRNA2_167790_c1_seq1.p1  ORF type:complete len:174 (+),score=33.12 gnl/TRDRNA2_/TRDRNA2_167790_c1_seq1:92-613(+)